MKEGTILYHGSYSEVGVINLSLCKEGKDFGKGFYLTTSLDQALHFVDISMRKHEDEGFSRITPCGFVSRFILHEPQNLSIRYFNAADSSWLHLVSANRRRALFHTLLQEYSDYDVIGGKIANDQTARVLQLYLSGAYGKPGEERADAIAIEMLLPNKLSDQYCFRTEKAIRSLEFIGNFTKYVGDK